VPDPFNPQSLNRYSYCLNNPLRYIDPSGHNGDTVDYYLDPSEYEGNDALWGFDVALPGISSTVRIWIPNADVEGILTENDAFWDAVTGIEQPENLYGGTGFPSQAMIAVANWNAANPNPTGEPSFLGWLSDQGEDWNDHLAGLTADAATAWWEQQKQNAEMSKDLAVDVWEKQVNNAKWLWEHRQYIIGPIMVTAGAVSMGLAIYATVQCPFLLPLTIPIFAEGFGMASAGIEYTQNGKVEPGILPCPGAPFIQ